MRVRVSSNLGLLPSPSRLWHLTRHLKSPYKYCSARFVHLKPVIEEMPILTLLLAAVYLLAIYLLLTVAKRLTRLARHSSRDVGQVS